MLTSQELHENDWEDFDSKTIRFLIAVTKEILTEIFVLPKEISERRKKLAMLKNVAKDPRK